jgi:hypothetical protein
MTKKKYYSPIAIFTYQRIDSLKKLLKSLKKNSETKNSSVYFFCDGPKSKKDERNTKKIILFLKSIKFFKNKKIILRKNNYGLKKNIVDGINEVFKKNKTIIVLEDDLIVSKYFLNYMNNALNKYYKNKKIFHINGWSFKVNINNKFDVYFSRYMNCWGWGTWKNRWSLLNEKSVLKSSLNWSKKKINEFNIGSSINLYDQISRNFTKKINTWAVFWYAAIFENNGICLTPNYSLVKNCGFEKLENNSINFLYSTNISNKKIINYPSFVTEDKIIFKFLKKEILKKKFFYYLNKNLYLSMVNISKLLLAYIKKY